VKQQTDQASSSRITESFGGTLIWILQISNLVLTVGLIVYGFFFMLPKIQVLEDRLAKNEMFIHGSREAIREELEQIKKDILDQCLRETESE
jgi:flagellar basal body-associated protein FliL